MDIHNLNGISEQESPKRMKRIILIVTAGYFPGKKYGGPPVSIDNFCSLLKSETDCYIVTRNHDLGERKPYSELKERWNDRGNVKVLYLSDKEYGYAGFNQAVKELAPDYIYLQSLFAPYVWLCLRIAKNSGIRVVLAPRGELCAGALKKKYKKIPWIFFLRMQRLLNTVTFQSTSNEETEAIRKYLGASKDNIHYCTNIPSIPGILPERIKKKRGESRIVFISRILWKKNLLFAINCLKSVTGKVAFDIFGPKENREYWSMCEKAITELPANIQVNYCGVLDHEEIHKTFNRYDAFLFPTLSENYGHVIAEALTANCIPIISDQTPWVDINEAGAGWALPLSDEKGFVKAIQEVVDMDNNSMMEKRKIIEKYLDNKLNLEELKANYLEIFK